MSEHNRPEDNRPEDNRVEDKRPERVPLGTGKNVLTAPQRDGYRRRFINDDGDRLKNALAAGYTFVEENVQVGDEDITPRNTSLGARTEITAFRDGTKAFLMELPEELAKEDDALKAKAVDSAEEAILNKPNEEGFYGEIKLR